MPPQPHSPCALPYQDKADALPPQSNLTAPLPGDQLVALLKGDDAAYNGLYPRFNANIEYAGSHCIASPPPPLPPAPKPSFLETINPFN